MLVLAYSLPKFLVLLRLLPLLLLIAQVSGLGFLRAPQQLHQGLNLHCMSHSVDLPALLFLHLLVLTFLKLPHTSFVAHLEKLEAALFFPPKRLFLMGMDQFLEFLLAQWVQLK